MGVRPRPAHRLHSLHRVGSAASPHRWRGAQPPARDGACPPDCQPGCSWGHGRTGGWLWIMVGSVWGPRSWSLYSETPSVTFGRVGQARPLRQQELPPTQKRGGWGTRRASKGAQPTQLFLPIVRAVDRKPGQQQRDHLGRK